MKEKREFGEKYMKVIPTMYSQDIYKIEGFHFPARWMQFPARWSPVIYGGGDLDEKVDGWRNISGKKKSVEGR
ncbi:unnamed protein product [Trifolium pratense]|uniref:Uncharacterized protein n=1 Tax=Trifolium pratense TaxID=57577 RepID=A0ACB0K6R5_TRIPR|nr:unnamed protein product [Trifolium pratense]